MNGKIERRGPKGSKTGQEPQVPVKEKLPAKEQ